MPVAYAANVKRWLQDHDTDLVDQEPPVQNTWYTVFNANDVRLLICEVEQYNDEEAAKDIEVRWTCDGNVYVHAMTAVAGDQYYIYRNKYESSELQEPLGDSPTLVNAAMYVDKRALSFKVEVRITSVVGTNQILVGRCVRETLEQT